MIIPFLDKTLAQERGGDLADPRRARRGLPTQVQ